MWQRSGRSSALDRAEALLSSRGRSDVVMKSSPVKAPVKTVPAVSSVTSRPSFKDRQVFSDLSDLSSVSLASERELRVSADAGKTKERGVKKTTIQEPATVVGVGSRFLKKPQAAKSTASLPVKSQAEPSSAQLSSQTAALRRLAQIERRFEIPKTAGEKRSQERAPVHGQDSDVGLAPAELPVESEAITETKNRFLKKKASVAAADFTSAGATGYKARTHGAEEEPGEDPSGLKYHVSLESDEEDIRKLIGNSLESSDNSFSSVRKVEQKSEIPKAPSLESSPSPPPPPLLRNSPFRFTGPPHAHFSPSTASRTPSPPTTDAPQRSSSSVSAQEDVTSLDELFPAEPSKRSNTSSDSLYRVKVMGVDQLVPASPESLVLQNHLDDSVLKSLDHDVEDDEDVYYGSDFESETQTTASQVSSDHVPEEIEEELQKETTHEDDVSLKTHSETSRRSDVSRHSPMSSSFSSNSESRRSHSSCTFSEKLFKEAAVQTQPEPWSASWSAGLAAATSVEHMVNITPITAHSVHGLQSFNPAGRAFLHEVFQQQLVMMRSFIERNRRLHASLMQSLDPPDYRYTTLEDTMKSIHEHRKSKLPVQDS